MLDVAVALPGAGEGRGPAEEMGVAVVEESEEETAKTRMEFGARWHGIDREEQKAAAGRRLVTEDESGGSGIPFWSSGEAAPTFVSHTLSRSTSSAEDAREVLRGSAGM
jgi:hypothetical protein